MGTTTADRDVPLSWIGQAAFVTGIVHGLVLVLLGEAGTGAVGAGAGLDAPPAAVSIRMCGDRRCPFREKRQPRRSLDHAPFPEIDLIEVALIPRLGMKEPEPKELPKLIKYEQPEVIQDAINIEKPPEIEEPPPKQEPAPQPEELDKRRKKPRSLDEIIEAPRDDDPRRRPTALDDIIGNPEGSAFGSDATPGEVNAVIARLQEELMRRFVVPSSLSDEELKRLRTRVRMIIEPNGSVSSYKVVGRSKNDGFDTAAEVTIKRFMPGEGGSFRLPDIPPDIRNYLNEKGVFVFDGRYIRR